MCIKPFGTCSSDWYVIAVGWCVCQVDGESGSTTSLTAMNRETKMVMKRILVKCADISNPCRPQKMCKAWAGRIAEEYFSQVTLYSIYMYVDFINPFKIRYATCVMSGVLCVCVSMYGSRDLPSATRLVPSTSTVCRDLRHHNTITVCLQLIIIIVGKCAERVACFN